MRRRYTVVLLLFVFMSVTLMASNQLDHQLKQAFKKVPCVEEVRCFTGKEAVFKGVVYSHLIVFTVNTRYTTYQGDALQAYVNQAGERLKSIVKTDNGLLVFQNEKGLVYDTFPYKSR